MRKHIFDDLDDAIQSNDLLSILLLQTEIDDMLDNVAYFMNEYIFKERGNTYV